MYVPVRSMQSDFDVWFNITFYFLPVQKCYKYLYLYSIIPFIVYLFNEGFVTSNSYHHKILVNQSFSYFVSIIDTWQDNKLYLM